MTVSLKIYVRNRNTYIETDVRFWITEQLNNLFHKESSKWMFTTKSINFRKQDKNEKQKARQKSVQRITKKANKKREETSTLSFKNKKKIYHILSVKSWIVSISKGIGRLRGI